MDNKLELAIIYCISIFDIIFNDENITNNAYKINDYINIRNIIILIINN